MRFQEIQHIVGIWSGDATFLLLFARSSWSGTAWLPNNSVFSLSVSTPSGTLNFIDERRTATGNSLTHKSKLLCGTWMWYAYNILANRILINQWDDFDKFVLQFLSGRICLLLVVYEWNWGLSKFFSPFYLSTMASTQLCQHGTQRHMAMIWYAAYIFYNSV